MVKILLKACPKCGGDIELPHNSYLPKYLHEDPTCIQCGFVYLKITVSRLKQQQQLKLKVATDEHTPTPAGTN